MTLEEFFIKKKIDLPALHAADPNLYKEFAHHFTQMGEKSFDHSKKFWFNRLRKSYLLSEPSSSAAVDVKTQQAKVTETPLASTTTATTGFKPRFKAKVNEASTAADEHIEETSPAEQIPVAKAAGFKLGLCIFSNLGSIFVAVFIVFCVL